MTEITRSRIGVNIYLAPHGSLADVLTLEALSNEVQNAINRSEYHLIIDLANVPTLTSRVLEAFLNWREQLVTKGGALTIVNANALNFEILTITEVAKQIKVVQPHHQTTEEQQKKPESKRLGDLLLELQLITPEVLDKALQFQNATGKRLGSIFIEKGWVAEKDFLKALSAQLGIPYVHLRQGIWDATISNIIPRDAQQRMKVLPLFKVNQRLVIANNDPQNLNVLDELRNLTGCVIHPVLAASEEIIRQIQESDNDMIDIADYLTELEEDFEVMEESREEDLALIDELSTGSPVINLVNSLIQRAVRDGASDIHIEPSRKKPRIRFRLDGVLYEVMNLTMEMYPAVISRLKVMANLDIAERRLPQDGRIQVNTQGRLVDLRLSTLPGMYGEKVVLRVLDKNQRLLDIDQLSLSNANQAAFIKLLKRSHGLILVTGPTGSGKTTTLYAALNYLNSIEKSIVTIEDPVEYQIDIINQNPVREAIGLTFAKILKHVLRQDPDIIMVGEIRERETAEIAVQAALTGHLVLSTLHTNESTGAITRLIDMGIEPYLLSSALIGVVAQRLIRTICPHCKTSYIATPEEIEYFHWQEHGQVRLAKGRGCPQCYDSGYKGRMAIHEVLTCDTNLQKMMVSNPSQDELKAFVHQLGMATLYDDGLERVLHGLTTAEEVSRVTVLE